MAIKRRNRDGTIEYIRFKHEDDKDARIKRLVALVKELTAVLSELTGFEKPVAAASTYDCYK
jgi:hypothetical protein